MLWPPIDRSLLGTCPSGVAITNVFKRAFGVLADHIANPRPVATFDHVRVNATFPSIHWVNLTNSSSRSSGNGSTTAAAASNNRDPLVTTVLNAIKSFATDVVGIDPGHVTGFLMGGEVNPQKPFLTRTHCDTHTHMRAGHGQRRPDNGQGAQGAVHLRL